jgi:archaellum component FlaC
MPESAVLEREPHVDDSQPHAKKLKKFHAWLTNAENERREYETRWKRDVKRLRGKIDEGYIPAHRCSMHVNDLHMILQRTVAILTDSRPALMIGGREPQDDSLGQVIKALVDRVFDLNDLLNLDPEIVEDAFGRGTAVVKVDWDADMGELGDVSLSVRDPSYIYPEPSAKSFRTARYIIEILPMTSAEIKERWPEQAKKIMASGLKMVVDKNTPRAENEAWSNLPYVVQAADGSTLDLSKSDRDANLEDGEVYRVMEIWYREGSKKGKRAYVVGNHLVEDKDAPYRAHGDRKRTDEWPYLRVLNTRVSHEFWGMSDVEQLFQIQRGKTAVLRKIIDWINYTVNPQIVAESSTGIDPKKMTTKPGILITVKPGTLQGFKWREVEPIPAGIFGIVSLLHQSLESVSGIQESVQGQKPSSNPSAAAIQKLQEAAQTTLRLKGRNLEAGMKRMGELILARIQQFYNVGRVVRVVGDTGKMQTLYLNQRAPQGAAPAPEEFGQFKPEDVLKPTSGSYDIRIEGGSMLPVSKAAHAELAVELSKITDQTGEPVYLSRRAALKAAQFPNADQLQDEVLQRTDVIARQQQALQQSEQQMEELKNELTMAIDEAGQQGQKDEAEINRLQNNIESLTMQLAIQKEVAALRERGLTALTAKTSGIDQEIHESRADRRVARAEDKVQRAKAAAAKSKGKATGA